MRLYVIFDKFRRYWRQIHMLTIRDGWKKMDYIKKHNMCLEMNTSKGLGVNKEFLDFAVKNSVKFSTGSDAHRVEDVGRKIKEVDMLISRSLK